MWIATGNATLYCSDCRHPLLTVQPGEKYSDNALPILYEDHIAFCESHRRWTAFAREVEGSYAPLRLRGRGWYDDNSPWMPVGVSPARWVAELLARDPWPYPSPGLGNG